MSSASTHTSASGEYTGPAFDDHDKRYLRIAAILGVITAIEIACSYINGLKGGLLAAVLMSFGFVKFVLVAGEFMHLKFDNQLLKKLFLMGAILAAFCYIAVLTAMGALRTPRFVLPVHWLVYIVASAILIAVWIVPRNSGDTEGHDHADHADDHAGHSH
jgi:cytochrome c oxidase subunit IV